MRSFTLAVFAGLFLLTAGSAQAAPSVTGTFNLPLTPQQSPPALGPDGNVWVTLQGGPPDVAKVAPDGTVTPYTIPGLLTPPVGINVAADGLMWVTGNGYVARFSVSDPTIAIKTLVPNLTSPQHITPGPDGNIWTASNSSVFKIPPTAVPVQEFPTGIAGFSARGITPADGRLWIANSGAPGGVLPMSVDGTPGTQILFNKQVQQVTTGPVGQIAYTSPDTPETIGRIIDGVAATPTPVANIDPFGIIYGQDEAYWTAQFGGDSIARYTSDGVYTIPITLPTGSGPRFLTRGAGDTIWVALETTNKIVRISGIETPDRTAPVITKFKLTRTKFKVGTKKTALVAKSKKKKAKAGTTLSYNLSENATTSIAVLKATAGRKSGTSCVKPTKKLKKAKKCTRYAVLKTLTRLQLAGANKVSFSGRIGKTKLKAGKYRFSVTGVDAKGNVSLPVTKSFRIVKR